jgi:peptidoglycan-N-acetylglucosamine deacetylase
MDPEPSKPYKRSNLFVLTILPLIVLSIVAFYFSKGFKEFKLLDIPTITNSSVPEKEQVVLKKKKTIYLTFDDGPCSGTNIVMNILKAEQIRGSFFIIGLHTFNSTSQHAIYNTLKSDNQFELVNHSYTHANKNRFNSFYAQPKVVVTDFTRFQDSIQFSTKVVRLPGRNVWRLETVKFSDNRATNRAADSLYENGFRPMGWDAEWRYNRSSRLIQTEPEMLQQVDSLFARNGTMIGNHLVILTHERTFETAEDSTKLHQFIKDLKSRNEYNFEVVSKYPLTAKDTIGIPKTIVKK